MNEPDIFKQALEGSEQLTGIKPERCFVDRGRMRASASVFGSSAIISAVTTSVSQIGLARSFPRQVTR
jgi:hypothetical protein